MNCITKGSDSAEFCEKLPNTILTFPCSDIQEGLKFKIKGIYLFSVELHLVGDSISEQVNPAMLGKSTKTNTKKLKAPHTR